MPEPIEVKKATVESFLNDIDYSTDPDYVPSDFALEFVNFIKLVNGDKGEENLTPVIHFKILDQVVSGNQNIANMCARGTAKTTVLAEYLFLYLAVYGTLPSFGSINYALYVSDSIENGVKKMRLRLERRRENSEFLMHYIPTVRFTDIRWYFKNIDGDEFVVTGHGAKTGVRGTVELNTRPQLAILDDLMSDEDARSATVITSIEDTVYKAIDYALHPTKQKIVWSGTPFNARDPLYKAIESGAWAVNVYPICEKFPCTEEEFVSAWPDRFTYAYVKGKYDKALALGKINTFNQELMLRIMSEEERLIKDNEIGWYKRSSIMNYRSRFNFYITTDFATGAEQANDFSVVAVWALSNKGHWFLVDGICRKQLMDKNINDLFRLAQKYNPQQVGIEVSGQQGGFIPWIQEQMLTRNIYFNLASEDNKGKPGIKPNTNKMVRFNIILPNFKALQMFFPEELKNTPMLMEYIDELSLASQAGFKSKHDDCLDCISMLGSLVTWRPSEDTVMTKDSDGIWHMDDEEEIIARMDSYIV